MSMSNTEKALKDIRRNTRRKYSTKEKIRIVLDGLRGESSIAEICRREGINSNLYYRWSKDFLEAGKKRLSGDIVREASPSDYAAIMARNLLAKIWKRGRINMISSLSSFSLATRSKTLTSNVTTVRYATAG